MERLNVSDTRRNRKSVWLISHKAESWPGRINGARTLANRHKLRENESWHCHGNHGARLNENVSPRRWNRWRFPLSAKPQINSAFKGWAKKKSSLKSCVDDIGNNSLLRAECNSFSARFCVHAKIYCPWGEGEHIILKHEQIRQGYAPFRIELSSSSWKIPPPVGTANSIQMQNREAILQFGTLMYCRTCRC